MDYTKRKIGEFFNVDAKDYLHFKYLNDKRSYMYIRLKMVEKYISQFSNKLFNSTTMILDAGCGPGILIEKLLGYNVNYIGIDLSENMLQLSQKRITMLKGDINKGLMRSDIESLPFKNKSFDLVISLGVIEYLENDTKVLSEFNRVLKPNSYLLIAVTNRYSYNLIFDNILEFFKNNNITASILGNIKMRMNLGGLRRREFLIRKHSPVSFNKQLDNNGFDIIKSDFFCLNALPYPFDKFVGKFNDVFLILFNKLGNIYFKYLGEGYLILCKKKKSK